MCCWWGTDHEAKKMGGGQQPNSRFHLFFYSEEASFAEIRLIGMLNPLK